ncbi:hypothetical protein C6A37_11240, partial [Desulfobacteraceae bacterium SEEP-SAG9]
MHQSFHPTYRSFKEGHTLTDDIRKYSLKKQTAIIGDALSFLASHGINDIVAYRSGGFYSDLNTIKALKNNNIKYSCNYNIAYPNCSYIKMNNPQNDIFYVDNVFE